MLTGNTVPPRPDVPMSEDEKMQFNQKFTTVLHAVQDLDQYIERYAALNPQLTFDEIRKILSIVSELRVLYCCLDCSHEITMIQIFTFMQQKSYLEQYTTSKRYIMSTKTLDEATPFIYLHARRASEMVADMVRHVEVILMQQQRNATVPGTSQPSQNPPHPAASLPQQPQMPQHQHTTVLQPPQPRNQTPMLPPAVPPLDDSSIRSNTPRPSSTQPAGQAQSATVSRSLRSHQGASPAASAGSPPQQRVAPTQSGSSPQIPPPPSPARPGAAKNKAGASQRKGATQKRKGSTARTNATAPPPAQAPVEIFDDTPGPPTIDTPSPASGSSKRQRQEDFAAPEPSSEDPHERSPKRSKMGDTATATAPTPDDSTMAANVANAMQTPENAASFHEAAIENYGSYTNNGRPGTANTDEITVGTVGGSDAPSLDELLQRVQTQVVPVHGENILSSNTAGSLSSPWLQKDSDSMWLSVQPDLAFRSTSASSVSTIHESAFDITDFFDASLLTFDDVDDAFRITVTPEMVPALSGSQGPTPNSILESPAGSGLSRPLDASPKGLRETATDHALTTFTASSNNDFYPGNPEASLYHRGTDFLFDGDMTPSEWPITYDDRIVSSTA